MQTFLPYKSFKESAKCLDRQRLGKQRVEAWQILRTITGQTSGWKNHPAVKMWKGYANALCIYGSIICNEWIKRGYKDNLKKNFVDYMINQMTIAKFPPWLGDESFHASHRSDLLRKNPEHYSQFEWKEPDNLPYIWPKSNSIELPEKI